MVLGGTAVASVAALSGAATGETENAPQPDDTSQFEYPTMTNDASAPVCTVYGGHNCPYTEDFVANSLGEIIERFVEPGRLTLTFRALEYDYDGDPWISENGVMAGQAAEGVWEEDPDSYWQFFAELWEHMPGQVDRDTLEEYMNNAGVDNASYIADNLENWDPDLQQTSDDAESAGVEYSPTLELKGDLGNRKNAVEWIEQRLDGDGSSSSQSSQDTSGDSDGSSDSGSADSSGGSDDSSSSSDPENYCSNS